VVICELAARHAVSRLTRLGISLCRSPVSRSISISYMDEISSNKGHELAFPDCCLFSSALGIAWVVGARSQGFSGTSAMLRRPDCTLSRPHQLRNHPAHCFPGFSSTCGRPLRPVLRTTYLYLEVGGTLLLSFCYAANAPVRFPGHARSHDADPGVRVRALGDSSRRSGTFV